MPPWYRVFGTSDTQPEPAAVLAGLRASGHEAAGHFRGDDRGWFRAELLPAAGSPLEVECYLADEQDIRHELNSWAAWLEAAGESETHARLMRHMIATTRLFTLHPEDAADADALCVALCALLAEATAGVYQIDGRGFFAADGTLLVAED
jgi:hypothetical protein